jgi:hypothetical protein
MVGSVVNRFPSLCAVPVVYRRVLIVRSVQGHFNVTSDRDGNAHQQFGFHKWEKSYFSVREDGISVRLLESRPTYAIALPF